ncbi:TetR/AcrR family transcriptional regulator C-terminal domain-containing protein [Streptomyces varsoviensis]|uniref:TetR/AcrR family transcriptional regulator n=1 Tax=Streptomyces varsoviensis TaxID=67373 RepID=UPI0033D4A910
MSSPSSAEGATSPPPSASTSPPAGATRGRPARLDPSRTVETALRLLDESGLDALTMRRLAEAEGARAGALYRYFATKQELLTAMAERMLAGVAADAAASGGAGDWGERLAALARAMRTALLARRDGARVYAGTHSTGPNTLGFAEGVTEVLREAGFGDETAARALMAVSAFTLGHTLEEQAALEPAGADGSEGGAPADPERLSGAVASGPYPHLSAALPTLAEGDFTAHFEFGLRLLVAGLRSLEHPRPA